MSEYQEIINQVENGDVEGLIDLSNLEAPDFNALGDFDNGTVDSGITFGIPDKKRAEDFKPIALESINNTQKQKKEIIFDTQCKNWEIMGPNGVCEVTKRKVNKTLEQQKTLYQNQNIETKTNYLKYSQNLTSNEIKILSKKLLDSMNMKEIKVFADNMKGFRKKGIKIKNYSSYIKAMESGEKNNSLQEYTKLFSNYKGKIRSSRDLRRACSKLGIDVRDLQKNIGTKADGVIGKNTFREFKRYIMIEPAYSNVESDGGITQTREQREMVRDRLDEIDGLKNREYLEALNLPRNFQIIGKKFLNKLPEGRELLPSDPLALVDAGAKKICYVVNGKIQYFDTILGSLGLTRNHKKGDKKTEIGKIHEFTKGKVATTSGRKGLKSGLDDVLKGKVNSNGDASNRKSTTIKGFSLQSAQSDRTGGKYFHGVEDWRMTPEKIANNGNGNGTSGCIGMRVADIQKIFIDVAKRGKGYGYVDIA